LTSLIAVAALVVGGLVGVVLLCLEAGHRIGVRRRSLLGAAFQPLQPTVEGAIFGLMGLLVSFTFYGASTRFEARRSLIVREANAIGTTYLRLDLLPTELQPGLREHFRNYLRSRLAVIEQFPNIEGVESALSRSTVLQQELWKQTVEAVRLTGPAEKSLVMAALNETIDITTDSTVALATHPPRAVFGMLGLSVIIASTLAGYGMSGSATRDWVSTICFALMLGFALYMILDYEFPRIGLIRIDPVDQVLVDTLNRMK
jgi:hypothetical protein